MDTTRNASIGATDDTPREIELKLEIAPDDTGKLLVHPAIAQSIPLADQSGRLHAVYYDTADQALRHAGLSLRIRDREGHRIQTVKAQREARGLSLDRSEWESLVADGLDFEAARKTPLHRFIADEAARASIQPAFSVETERQAFLITRDGTAIELALDRAHVTAGTRTSDFCEVELELKEGEPAALFAVATDLAKDIPLRLSFLTKSERGYGVLDGSAAAPVLAEQVEIPPQTASAQAFQIIARSCLFQIVQNEAAFRASRVPEALHQMRVGFRRLVTALSLFREMLTDRESKALRQDIRAAAELLGPARDLDVLLGRLHDSPDVGSHKRHIGKVERQQAKAYDKLLATLEAPRFGRTLLQAAAWVETGRWLTRRKHGRPAARNRSITDHAATELERRWKRIRRSAKRMADLDADERHRLRMRIKKLRYASEFLAHSFSGKEARRRHRSMLAKLKHLQDLLGEINDLAVGKDLLRSPLDAKLAEQRHDKLLTQAVSTAQSLRKAPAYWT